MRIIFDEEAMRQLRELKALLAHQHPGISTGEFFKLLLREKLDLARKKKGIISAGNREEVNGISSVPPAERTEKIQSEIEPVGVRLPLAAAIRRQVWSKAQGRCEARLSKKGEALGSRCNSTYALEIDHVKPIALGGTNELSNLRLLCRNHNTQAALNVFGQELITKYRRH